MRTAPKIKTVTLAVLGLVVILGPFGYSHCQVPCGIYDDEARFGAIREHVATIEKSMNSINELSDHRNADFGRAFGVLIPQLRLLARAVFVVDGEGVIRYKQLVGELTNEPDYAAAIEAAKGVTV